MPFQFIACGDTADSDQIRLSPLERRWVVLTIDRAKGEKVAQFDKRYELIVTETIDGVDIGGMTFYVAPPPAEGEA